MKSKVSKKGILLLIGSLAIITILIIPPQFYATSGEIPITAEAQAEIDFILSNDGDIDNLLQNSVISTNKIFTETDQSLLINFLDAQGLSFTEKFGILSDIALISPDSTVLRSSDIFGISQLSVTDELGVIRDLDTIQTSFKGITRNTENSVNVWGVVEFFLDDTLVQKKTFWASTNNESVIPLSLVNNLSFKNEDINISRINIIESEVVELTAEIIQLQEEIATISVQSCTNCNGRDTEIRIRQDRIIDIRTELSAIHIESAELKIRIGKRIPINPSFSERETNFTFTLSDEGRDWVDQSEHFYRVVLTEIHANLDSEKDIKEFNWFGEHIAYELKVTVDESKITILDDNNSAIEIFKSDNTFSITSPTVTGSFSGDQPNPDANELLQTTFELFIDEISLGKLSNDDFNGVSSTRLVCGGYPVARCINYATITVAQWENPILNIPRDTDIVIRTGDGQTFEIHTPLSQVNYFVSCRVSDGCHSNFGYKFP